VLCVSLTSKTAAEHQEREQWIESKNQCKTTINIRGERREGLHVQQGGSENESVQSSQERERAFNEDQRDGVCAFKREQEKSKKRARKEQEKIVKREPTRREHEKQPTDGRDHPTRP
jgi:hypothetical protein